MSARSLTSPDRAGLGEPVRIAADPAQLEAVRDLAGGEAERFGLDAQGIFRFKLAASEAVANAIEHGAPAEDGMLELWVYHDAARLVFCVRDLMAALVDDVRIDSRPDATTVTLTQFRPQAERAA